MLETLFDRVDIGNSIAQLANLMQGHLNSLRSKI